MPEEKKKTPTSTDSFTGCLMRFAWMAAANLALFFSALHIVQEPALTLSWGDGGVAAAVVFSVGARYLDIRLFAGETSEGVPATMRDWRLHALRMPAIGAAVLLLAHAVAATGWFS